MPSKGGKMRERKGYVSKDKNGKWFCRITATDNSGKRRDIKRTANSKAEAREILEADHPSFG
jgi:hypothetical protein